MRAPSAAEEPRKPPKRRAHPEPARGLRARAARDHEPGGYLQRPAHHSLPQARRPALHEPRRVGHRVVRPPRRLARSGGREAAAHPHPYARQVGHPRGAPNTSPEQAGSRAQTAALAVGPTPRHLWAAVQGSGLAWWGELASLEMQPSHSSAHLFSPPPSPALSLLLLGLLSPDTKSRAFRCRPAVVFVLFVVYYVWS